MEIGTVKLTDIEHEMRTAYLDYAMSVITARALPDVRDGLKPVQRRILYAMNELGLDHTAAYKKSARIVGEVLGKYHPHGDAPVYETMVRMAQDFSMRYVLVDGQGNFGSVDGDPPAAMRYTEARLSQVAEEMLADLDKNTVDFVANFDGTLKEPAVLPARLPNLLVNGASGIAVGMATNIPPHNLKEVADAIIFMLDQFQRAVAGGIPFDVAQARVHNRPVDRETILGLRGHLSPEFKALVAQEYEAKVADLDRSPKGKEQKDELEYSAILDIVDQLVDVPLERLMEFIAGPDFPTGGIIVGRKGITDAYTTGHGRVVIRAKAFIEDRGGDRSAIIVTELPYQVNKASLVERIADLVRDKRIEGVAELRDESDRHGMRIVIELRRDVQARQILNNLFKLTAMQSAFSVNLLALVDGEPRVLNLKRLLQHYIDYRHQVITRRTQFELEKAQARAHILEGLKIALDNLDEVISTIRNSPDADTARNRLMKRFKLTELQAQAILDMQLRRLAALERKKIEQELADTLKLIGQLQDLLAHPIKMYGLIKQDLLDLKQKYGDERRTKIREEEAEDFTAEDLIPDEDVVIALSSRGYIKRVPAEQYRAQPRRSSSRSVTAVVNKEQDPVTMLLSANTHDSILFISNVGKGYGMKAHEIPPGDRQARGVPLSNFLSTAMADERIVGMVALRNQTEGSLTLVTRMGEIKRVLLADMMGARPSGLNVMALEARDEVIWAGQTDPDQEIIIVTAQAKAIRFTPEEETRSSGRGSGGVRAIRLESGDHVVAVDVVDDQGALLVVTTRGFAKRTDLTEYSAQGRGGGGIVTATITDKNGPLAAARVVSPGDEVAVVSAHGQVVRLPVDEIPGQARAGRGSKIIELESDDQPVAILRLKGEKRIEADTARPEPAPTTKTRRAKTATPTSKQEKVPATTGTRAKAAAPGKTTEAQLTAEPPVERRRARRQPANTTSPATEVQQPDVSPRARKQQVAAPEPEAEAKLPEVRRRARKQTAETVEPEVKPPVVRTRARKQAAPEPVKDTTAKQATPSAKPAGKRRGKDDIVIRAGGKTTIVPRSDLLPTDQAEPSPAKKPRTKTQTQSTLPLWGDDKKK